jgi:DNA mismatch repair protein MutS
MIAIRDCLDRLPEVKSAISTMKSAIIQENRASLNDMSSLSVEIRRAIFDDPPISPKDGNLIRDGYDDEIDTLRKATKDDQDWIAGLEESERKRVGIKNLKVGFNNIFGYYIEVSKSNLRQVPADYERKQTLTAGERFITPELKERERAILSANERMSSLEYEAYIRIRERVASQAQIMREISGAVGMLDVLCSFAEVAVAYKYCRPDINESDTIIVKDGRHPVVERSLRGGFVPNDSHLDTNLNRLIILTGPNMAGKSTYLRQVADIVVLAQCGSFVPASEASVGVVDRIFTRVGAFDDLARGQSTFMVEMTELANILNSASKRSLILLDEVGRGTSTFDGLAIAWAVSEYLYDHTRVGAKSLFATHYHQLTELAESLEGVKNYSMAVKEQGSEVIFLRKVLPGRANKSYGIQVAKLAGVPREVVSRAAQVLTRIEEENALEVKAVKKSQKQSHIIDSDDESSIERELAKLRLEKMTPMEAYLKLIELKKKVGVSRGKQD